MGEIITQLFLIQFFSNLAPTLMLIYIPLIAENLGAKSAIVGLVISIYYTTFLISGILFGRLSDLKEKKRYIIIGLGLSSLAFLSHLLIKNLPSLFIIRAFAGFAVGIFPAALFAYFYEKNTILGKFTATGSLGFAVGSIIAGIIAIYNTLFIVAAIIFIFIFILAIISLNQKQTMIKQPFWDFSIIKRNWRV